MIDENIQQMNLWQRLVGIITRPKATLEAVVEKPTLLWPALVILLINLGFFAITIPKLQQFTLWLMENSPQPQMPLEQLSQAMSMASTFAAISGGLAAMVIPLFAWLVYAMSFKVINFFVANKTSFKKLFAVAIISYVPTLLGAALRNVLVATAPAGDVTAVISVTTSAALALPKGNIGPLFTALSNIDPFYIWSLALLAMGGAIAMRTTVRITGVMVFILWLLITVITTGVAMLNPQQLPGA